MIFLGATARAAFLLAELNWDLRLTSLTLVGVLLIGAVIVAVVAKWRKRNQSDELSPSEQLAEYRSLYLEGAISKEEFEQLRAVLGGEMRRQLDVPISNKTSVTPETARPDVSRPAAPVEEKPPSQEPPANGVQPG